MPDNSWSQPARWSSASLLFVSLLSLGAGWTAARIGQLSGAPPSPSAALPASALVIRPTAEALGVPAPSVVASQPSSSPAQTSAPHELAKASSGDILALKTIEGRPPRERSIGESLALEAGHAALVRQEAERLVADLRAQPKLLHDRSTLAYAYRLALDPVAAPSVLGGLAGMADPTALDLLFDLVARGDPGSRLVLLALDLLESAKPRGSASKALRVALDLRAARDCWQAAEVIARAIEDGDERSLSLLERMRAERGCGPKQQDDCYGCLREPPHQDRLEQALAAVRSRPFKAPWRPAQRPPR